MIRVGQLLLVVAAIGLWVASRLPWVAVTSSDGLGQPKTSTLTGGTWSNALIPMAVLLLAAAIAGLAVHGWGLRVVAVLVALVSLVLGYLGVSLFVMPDIAPRAAELAQVPVMSLVASQRHHLGAGLTLAAAVVALLAAVLLMRSAGSARHTAARYAAPAARRTAAGSGDAGSERGMWDAIDEGHDPTEHDTEGR
ncbi:TIGR02234 family membrane protein [Candidatus Mycolicibacterium alkanivorans]|uniref:TIGR02234 family membrane protein n=1 Tax=Candidatus Mycolicibacterium alkanivorans TaxID=2954114 RepID=A0ABS9Z0B4_9MYCO|nr:TIGR02234 family membrane protein [Candidatus Mycolicibacterium alkanivorans]MCI4675999.1 TIGR02234 family membrane protein [Candidatus Mycolicibacterium alkanivorans]